MGELYRNICLAFACIFVTTLLLLSDFLASVQVLLAVLFTLVNVGGCMYFWGTTHIFLLGDIFQYLLDYRIL